MAGVTGPKEDEMDMTSSGKEERWETPYLTHDQRTTQGTPDGHP